MNDFNADTIRREQRMALWQVEVCAHFGLSAMIERLPGDRYRRILAGIHVEYAASSGQTWQQALGMEASDAC